MLFECVPNVSEGRNRQVVGQLEAAVAESRARLLDVSSDPDHNRSVFTFAGKAEQVADGLLRLAHVAVERLDLRQHDGVHPFLGALDVVPVVPLDPVVPFQATSDLSAARVAAVALAVEIGERLATELGVPIFLYEWAARDPARRNLADVRRGGWRAVAERMQVPGGAPDLGPAAPHPSAGATAVGARDFLVAFNALLDCDDLRLARRIARAVRQSSGGLPALKAIGVPLTSRGRAQVSMNLVDFRQTDLPTALAAVQAEAARYGQRVVESELIGLAPRAAFGGVDPERDLLLPDFDESCYLEVALAREEP